MDIYDADGLPGECAPKTITVTVTAAHIAAGHPSDCARCPIALALIDGLREAFHAEVWFDDDAGQEPRASAWLSGDRMMHLVLPAEAGRFANRFDEGGPVSPFTFTAEVTR